jgi:hypothetical protein
MSRVQLPNNEEAIIADFALDSTARAMLTQLVALNKGIGSGSLQKLVDHAKEAAKDAEKFQQKTLDQQKELHKATEDLGKEFKKEKTKPAAGNAPGANNAPAFAGKISDAANKAAGSLDGFNKGAAMGEKVFVGMYNSVTSLITGATAAIVLYGGILVDSFVGLGNELNELTKVGGGFRDSLAQGGMSASDAMAELSSMGIDAANTMRNMSGIMQTMNKKAFVGLTESFMDATKSGVELGMSLDDSVERMGAELAKRQQMGVLDGMNQARMQQQITRSIKTQQKYASVLGESVDNIVAFTDSLITQTPVLTSSLLKFDKELRGKVIAGITDFGSTMRAMGGEEGGQIAQAMTEAAASGAMGFSDQMTGYVRALPSLAGPMNDYITQIKNGTLSQEEAEQMAIDMTSQLGNLSKAEKQRVFLLDRAGDAQAGSMAKAIIQFEASEKKLKSISKDLTMEGIQKGTNTLTAIMKVLTGSFEAIKTNFLQGFGNIADGGADLGKTFENMKSIVSLSIGKAMEGFGLAGGAFDNLNDAGKSLGNQLGERLPKILESFAKYVGMAIEALPGIWEGIKSFMSGVKTVFNILSTTVSIAMMPIKFIGGVIEGVTATLKFGWDLLVGVFKMVGAVGGALVDLVMLPFKAVGATGGAILDLVMMPFKAVASIGSSILDTIMSPFRSVGDGISTAGEMVTKPFTSFGNFMRGIFDKISGVFSFFGNMLSPLFDAVRMPFDWLGKTLSPTFDKIVAPFSYLGDKIKEFAEVFTGGGLLSTIGKVAGAAGVLLVSMKALGVGMPKMLSGLADKITGGAKKIAGGLKDKIMGKKDAPDVGAMDKVGKKAGNLTKSIGQGMKNISKGIGDMLNNLSKGIGSVISNLAKSVGKAGASLGKGLGDMVGGALKGLGKGLSALGNPKALLGTVVLAALGGAMFVAGKAFQQFADINWAGVGAGALALGVLGVAAALIAPISPLLITGALAIGALGLALIPFAYAVSLAAPAMVELMGSFKLLNEVDPKNVLLLGPALVSLAAGMAAFSAGGLISGVLDGLGSLFGSESPFDKLAKIGAAAPAINAMTKNMNSFGTTVETFNDAMTQLDGAAISGEFAKMAEGIDTLNASMAEISLVSLMKMAAMKSFGPVQQEQKETLVKKEGAMTPNDPKANVANVDRSSNDPKANVANVDRSSRGRAGRRIEALEKQRAQMDMSSGSASGTFVGGKLVKPVASQPANTPAKAPAVLPPNATAPVGKEALNNTSETPNRPESNKALFERMIANQEQTNNLLRRGNKTTADLKDSF